MTWVYFILFAFLKKNTLRCLPIPVEFPIVPSLLYLHVFAELRQMHYLLEHYLAENPSDVSMFKYVLDAAILQFTFWVVSAHVPYRIKIVIIYFDILFGTMG